MSLKESLHRAALDTAIYFGKPKWAHKEAVALSRGNEVETKNIEASAYQKAAEGEANNGNHYRADELRLKAILIRPSNSQPQP